MTSRGSLWIGIVMVGIAGPAGAANRVRSDLEERVTVTATRLPAEPEEVRAVPAPVRVYTREEIEASGAATLQEFLEAHTTFHVFDQVGNPIQATVALRGFGDGTSLALVVDGVRFNEPDDNRASFDLIPLHDVERIEVVPGSYSSVYGGGTLAGVIHVITRTGADDPPFEGSAAAGSWGSDELRAGAGGARGDLTYYASASRATSDGWRDSTGSRVVSGMGRVDWKIAGEQHLGFSLRASDDDLGNAGSLTAAEIDADPRQNVFNQPDFSDSRMALGAIEYRARLDAFDVRASLSYRRNDVDILTTGRAAAAFGSGFLTETAYDTAGLTAQAGWTAAGRGARSTLAFGGDLRSSDFGSDGFFTDPDGSDPSLATVNRTDETVAGAFVDETLAIGERFTLAAGLRYDSVRLDFRQDDVFSGVTGGDRSYAEWSPRVGLTFAPGPRTRLYASAARAFQAPTVNQLFAFVGFGSNPDLEPQVATTYEIGLGQTLGQRGSLSLDLFRTDVDDEILFVFTDPALFLGENENLGDTRRRGVELALAGWLGGRVQGSLEYLYTDAEFTQGVDRNGDGSIAPGPDPITFTSDILPGDRLPVVPEQMATASLAWEITRRLAVDLRGLWVSEQRLSGDDANEAPELPSYGVLDLGVRFQAGRWEAFFRVRNLLDAEYETWGITNGIQEFFQPAPERSLSGGVRFRL
jgi:iron complex outermembrane receptor protein